MSLSLWWPYPLLVYTAIEKKLRNAFFLLPPLPPPIKQKSLCGKKDSTGIFISIFHHAWMPLCEAFLVLQQCTCWRNTANKWWINKKTLPHSSFSPSTCTFCYHKRCWLQIKANAFFLSYHFCHRPSLWNSSHNRKPFLSFLVHEPALVQNKQVTCRDSPFCKDTVPK